MLPSTILQEGVLVPDKDKHSTMGMTDVKYGILPLHGEESVALGEDPRCVGVEEHVSLLKDPEHETLVLRDDDPVLTRRSPLQSINCWRLMVAVVVLINAFAVVGVVVCREKEEVSFAIRAHEPPVMGICDEEHLYFNQTQLQEWKDAGVPILSTAMQNSDTEETYIFFRYPLTPAFDEDNNILAKGYNFLNARWSCNGLPATEPYPAHNLVHQVKLVNFFLIKCPKLPEPGNLINVTIETHKGEAFHYVDLKDFFRCQVHGHPASRILKQPKELVLSTYNEELSQDDATTALLPQVVLSTMIRGAVAQAYLPQWIEYHRHAFGVPHFFVYINEPWQTFMDRPSYRAWDFVTYIPFPLGAYHDTPFYYQRLQQNDMFWRIKLARLSLSEETFGSRIEWVGMMDIDEYLDVPAVDESLDVPAVNSSVLVQRETVNPVLRSHLGDMLDKYSKANTNDEGHEISGLSIRNTFYGGPNAKTFEWLNANGTAQDILLCRFTHRGEPFYRNNAWQRQKFFARVDTAVFMNVHLVHGEQDIATRRAGKKVLFFLDHKAELRFNHFKLNYGKPVESFDPLFRDTFCGSMKALNWA